MSRFFTTNKILSTSLPKDRNRHVKERRAKQASKQYAVIVFQLR